ncbi:MAG: helix-turn-helix transcriptional regulator [Hydrogenophaga sp.]|nr:helix-turn-helix transcriptional regulator [Hydrogenophaga sp.]
MLIGNALTVGLDKAVYLGELPATGWHRHAAPVLLVGLSGRFRLRWPDGRSEHCHSALIDAGVEHVFDPDGERVAILYLEPDAPEVQRLRVLFAQRGPVVGEPLSRVVDRWHTEQRLNHFDLDALIDRRLWPSLQPVDARVLRSLRHLRDAGLPSMPDREALARTVHLSSSRFNHLFSEEAGVSFRSYRVWSQVRRALAAYRPDGSLTDAALDGAFADSAHFSRMFRSTFGMTPSSVLKPLRSVTVLR